MAVPIKTKETNRDNLSNRRCTEEKLGLSYRKYWIGIKETNRYRKKWGLGLIERYSNRRKEKG